MVAGRVGSAAGALRSVPTQGEAGKRARLFEFPARCRLLRSDAARGDIGLQIVLASNRRAGESPEHRDLPNVRQRISNRPLEQLLCRTSKRRITGQSLIELSQRLEEAIDFLIPRERLRVLPSLLPVGERQRPVVQIADVSQDLPGAS